MFDAVGGCATDCNHSIVEGILQELDCANYSTFPGSTCVDKPDSYCSSLCHDLGGEHCESFQCDHDLGDCADMSLHCAGKEPEYCSGLCHEFSNGTNGMGCDMFQCNSTSDSCTMLFKGDHVKVPVCSDFDRTNCHCNNDQHDRICPHASCCDMDGKCLDTCYPKHDILQFVTRPQPVLESSKGNRVPFKRGVDARTEEITLKLFPGHRREVFTSVMLKNTSEGLMLVYNLTEGLFGNASIHIEACAVRRTMKNYTNSTEGVRKDNISGAFDHHEEHPPPDFNKGGHNFSDAPHQGIEQENHFFGDENASVGEEFHGTAEFGPEPGHPMDNQHSDVASLMPLLNTMRRLITMLTAKMS